MPRVIKQRRFKFNIVAQGNVLAKYKVLDKEFEKLKSSVSQKDIDKELKRAEKLMKASKILLRGIELGKKVKYDRFFDVKKRNVDEAEVKNIKTQNKRKNTDKNTYGF